MKKLVSISIFLVINFNICFSQVGRNVEVKPFIDTTTVEFRQIFNLWEKYMDTLFVYSVKSHFKISETNAGINSFWYHEDVENYSFADLAYTIPGSAMAFYPTEKEYFLGFDTRDTNMFELKSMFVNQNENVFRNTPDIIISQPVLKVGDNYKLINKFTLLLKEGKLIAKKINDVTYYYSPLYPFNNEKSQILSSRINEFKDGFQIIKDVEIKYLVADNITEIFEWLGVDYIGAFDYNATLSTIEGRAIPVNNMILSGGGGEDYMHEIIHIYLKNIRKGNIIYLRKALHVILVTIRGKVICSMPKDLKHILRMKNGLIYQKIYRDIMQIHKSIITT